MSSHTYHNFESLHYTRDTTVTHTFGGEGAAKAPGLGLPMAGTATIGLSPHQAAALPGFPGLLGGGNTTTNVHFGPLIATSFGGGHGCSSCGALAPVAAPQAAALPAPPAPPAPPSAQQSAYPSPKSIGYYPPIPPGRDAISLGCVKRVD